MFQYSRFLWLHRNNCSNLLMMVHEINKIYIPIVKALHSKHSEHVFVSYLLLLFHFLFSLPILLSFPLLSFPLLLLLQLLPMSYNGLRCYVIVWGQLLPGIHVLLASTWAILLQYKSKELVPRFPESKT